MKRIYLANITGAYQVVIPYSSGLLQSYCSADPQLFKNYVYGPFVFHAPQGVEVEVSRISNPAVLGLSLLSWNLRRSLKLARLVKDKFPDCLVVVGGPEVPDKSETFLRTHPYIDLAVHKEGEETFRQILVENLSVKPDWEKVSGISFVDPSTGAYRNIPRQHSFLNPISGPSPYLMGLFEESLDYVDHHGLPRVNIWETNRGCPYRCTFCDWGSAINQKVRLLLEERVNLEIDHIARTYDEVHVADANFGIHKRDLQFARRLAEVMEGGRLKSVHMNYIKALNEDAIEVAKILEARGISRAGFTFAFNSLDRSTLKTIKRYNMPREKFSAIKARMDELGIPTNAELIWGLPGETKDSFFAGFEACMEAGLTDIRAYQLNIYPNSEVSDERSRNEFEIETYWVKIVKGAVEDEDEYIETVKSTNKITSDEMWQVKKTLELIDVLHFGRWTFYLAQYLKNEMGIAFTKFYWELFKYSHERPDTVVAKVMFGGYIREYNSGEWYAFKGPHSPFGVDWRHRHFRKSTFFWLCIAENRSQFYDELRQFISEFAGWNDQLEDLIKFQNDMIIDFEYDPNVERLQKYQFNWYEWSKGRSEISKVGNTLRMNDVTVGRFNKELVSRCPESYFNVAGGYDFHFQKVNSFEFRSIHVNYDGEVRGDAQL